MNNLTIIIVSFNTKDLTLDCLRSVYAQSKNISFQLIVVDNNSSDGSAHAISDQFPQVELIELKENIGFARANNLAVQHANGKYLLLLNPDTIILDNAIEKLLNFAKQYPDAGIWGGRTLFPDGSLNPSSCWRQTTLWSLTCRALHLSALLPKYEFFNPESYGTWQRDTIRKVDIVSGCFLLIYNDLWKKLNGFDPSFFMYGEEADLCLRATSIKFQPIVTPISTIIHYGGASERVYSDKIIKLLSAKVLLMHKHWNQKSITLGKLLFSFWIIFKIILLAILCPFRPQLTKTLYTWTKVWHGRKIWLKARYPEEA